MAFRPTYRALLIANADFPEDPHNLPPLRGPRRDAHVLAAALSDPDVGLFPPDNVTVLGEPTMVEALRAIDDFLRAATYQDTLLLYYSGHGELDQSGEFFLCHNDTRRERLRSTAVKAQDVRMMIGQSAAAATVVLLDCCYSGRFKSATSPSALLEPGEGFFAITSSRSGDLANDTDRSDEASPFTHHVVEGLRHGAPDADQDGIVTVGDLYGYVDGQLRQEGRWLPDRSFQGHGEVPIARRAGVEVGLVTPEERPVLDVPISDIDLGTLEPGDRPPPERIAVVNRGGGTLDWEVSSSGEWVAASRDDSEVVLDLRPDPGPNLANVYIRDRTDGTIHTVRVRARVLPAPASPPGEADGPAASGSRDFLRRHGWRIAVWVAGLALVAEAIVLIPRGGDGDEDDPSGSTSSTAPQDPVSGGVVVGGSAAVEPISLEAVALAQERNPGLNVSASGTGTADGFALFCGNALDIVGASRPINNDEAEACEEAGIEYIPLPIGHDAVVVLTNDSLDEVDCLNRADLYALLGPESTGFDNWRDAQALATELGSTTELPDAPLDPIGPGLASGTYDTFAELAIADLLEERARTEDLDYVRADLNATEGDAVILDSIEASDAALGWIGFEAFETIGGAVLPVAIAPAPGDPCVEPADERISDRTYPLARQLYIYVNRAVADNPAVARYVDVYLANLPLLVTTTGYTPLSEDALADTRARWQGR